jgi:hypothetical protein
MKTLPGEQVSQTDMEKDSKEMHARASMLSSHYDVLKFQTEIMKDLASRTGLKVDFEKAVEYVKFCFNTVKKELKIIEAIVLGQCTRGHCHLNKFPL